MWEGAREKFEERMKQAGKSFGNAPAAAAKKPSDDDATDDKKESDKKE
jgi:hypothetical protein